MKTAVRFAWFGVALAIFALPAFGQNSSASPQSSATAPNPAVQTIQQREDNQQERIAQGEKSGALSAGQAAHLEKNDAKINNEVRTDEKANGGKLTAPEKAKINSQLNHQSNQIHQAMHGGGGRR